MNMQYDICIIGGHLTPALATIEMIRKIHPSWKVFFIGRKYSLEGSSALSEESRIIESMEIPFFSIVTGRLKRSLSVSTIVNLLLIPIGIVQSLLLLISHRPVVVLSFGGYVAVPVALASWLLHIPVITHEQTSSLGFANRIIGLIAQVICVSNDKTDSKYYAKKIRMTGLPIRSSLQNPPKETSFTLPRNQPIIYCIGGATGSYSVNHLIYSSVPILCKSFVLVHQVGRAWIQEAHEFTCLQDKAIQKNYFVFPYLDASDHSWLLHHTEVIISRSGANAVEEISMSDATAIFIPLPWSAANEQYLNAKNSLNSYRIMVDQKTLNSQQFIETIGVLFEANHARIKHPKFSSRSAENLVSEIAQFIR